MLPATRSQWRRMKTLVPQLWPSEKRTIENNVNWLISRLYYPHRRLGSRVNLSASRCKMLGIAAGVRDEPINWGDLSGAVERDKGAWIVCLEEAAPDDCPLLCQYIAGWLLKWGWANVVVETEW